MTEKYTAEGIYEEHREFNLEENELDIGPYEDLTEEEVREWENLAEVENERKELNL